MQRDRVLLVDDEGAILRLLAVQLEEAGFATVPASSGEEARRRLREAGPSAVVLDLNLPDVPGRVLLDEFRRGAPDLPVIVLTGEDGIPVAVECMRLGAFDYLLKPHDSARLVGTVRNALEQSRLRHRLADVGRRAAAERGFGTLVGASDSMARALALLRKAADSEVPVLLEGESGTGKEVAARAIHAEGARRVGPFVAVNCGAIPEGLVESVLFGHEKGAFTGATSTHHGVFAQADAGTLFLDEIGDLRLDLQVRLLRALQEGEIVPLGGRAPRTVDVRVLAATHRNLREEVARGRFREDLYYRLAVFPVRLPPLRDRGGDVLLLSDLFLREFSARHRRPPRPLSPDARAAVERYGWPGNVRELQNVLERACLLEEGASISLASLPDELMEVVLDARGTSGGGAGAGGGPPPAEAPGPLPAAAAAAAPVGPVEPLEDVERRHLLRALESSGWRVREAARVLGISRATLYRKIERFGFAPPAGP
ncbi:MAG: sigma-54 dependent transcriptional regulator [Planctomycetes bacterium]|nr:sigma-54 dependent transcriptional regulator [Planctomycetota bacterium]